MHAPEVVAAWPPNALDLLERVNSSSWPLAPRRCGRALVFAHNRGRVTKGLDTFRRQSRAAVWMTGRSRANRVRIDDVARSHDPREKHRETRRSSHREHEGAPKKTMVYR